MSTYATAAEGAETAGFSVAAFFSSLPHPATPTANAAKSTFLIFMTFIILLFCISLVHPLGVAATQRGILRLDAMDALAVKRFVSIHMSMDEILSRKQPDA